MSLASKPTREIANRWVAFILVLAVSVLPGTAWGQHDDPASTSHLEWELLEAETALHQHEPRIAASHYRGAIRETWSLLGLLALAEDDLQSAREAFDQARNASAAGLDRARTALAQIELRLGEVEQPLRELRLLAQENELDSDAQRRFAEALWATGRQDELRAQLDRLRAIEPSAAAEIGEAATRSLAERKAPLPPVGGLRGDHREQRDALRHRLAASLVRAYRNLAGLHAQTNLAHRVEGLLAEAESVSERYPEAHSAFGRLDFESSAPDRPIERPRLDPVALIASEPPPLHRALRLFDEGDLEGAEAELRQLLDGPEGSAARSLLGRLLADLGHLDEAEAELLRAIESAPEPAAAHQALARLYLHDGSPQARSSDQATQHLRRAAELAPLDRDLALALAEIEIAAGHTEAAEQQLRSLDKRFGSAEAVLRMVDLARRGGREKRALELARRATELAPNSEEALLTYVRQALAIGLLHAAAPAVEPLVRMCPEVAEYRLLLGEVWRHRRKMGEASEAYLKAVELDPDLVLAFLPLGLALNHESRFAEAKPHFERYLEAHPEDLEAIAGLAEAEERLGEVESAERRASRVVEQDSEHPRAQLVLGMLRMGRGELAAARDALERAAEADPLLAKAHYQLSLACARLRDHGCAAEHRELYKKALEGPEATYVQLKAAPTTTLMRKREPSGDSP